MTETCGGGLTGPFWLDAQAASRRRATVAVRVIGGFYAPRSGDAREVNVKVYPPEKC
jgi:hypothetical protein